MAALPALLAARKRKSTVLADFQVYFSDLQSARLASGEDFSAILGMDVLKKYLVSVDFGRGKISLPENLPGNPQTLGTPLELSFQSDTHFLTTSCGTMRQEFVIDTFFSRQFA